jgi:hypothetical protein
MPWDTIHCQLYSRKRRDSILRGRSSRCFEAPGFEMPWQDLELEAEQNEVLERLEESRPHPDIVVPFKYVVCVSWCNRALNIV